MLIQEIIILCVVALMCLMIGGGWVYLMARSAYYNYINSKEVDIQFNSSEYFLAPEQSLEIPEASEEPIVIETVYKLTDKQNALRKILHPDQERHHNENV